MAELKYIELKNDVISWTLFISGQLFKYIQFTTSYSLSLIYILIKQFYGIIQFFCSPIVKFLFISLKTIWLCLSFTVFIIFEPFNLFIRIIEFNVRKFIDFWLSLLFNTKLEDIFTIEYGKLQFKILVQWVRFINVMIITGLILGILTYYTSVRIIYWMTQVEKKKKKEAEEEKDQGGNVIDDRIRETIFGTFDIDKLEEEHQEQVVDQVDKFWRDEEVERTRLFQDINSTLNDRHEEDDVYNYESLNSLKPQGINESTRSRAGQLFDSMGRGSIDSNQGTGTTSIFSRLNLTPITTIEEEEEEQYK